MEIQINREELNKIYDGCNDTILEVIEAFLETENEVLDELNIAFSNCNENLIRQQLHFHAPVFGYVGFPQVSEFIKTMELKYTYGINAHEAQRDHQQLIEIIKKVVLILTNEKNLLKNSIHA